MSDDTWTLSTREFRSLWEECDGNDYPIEFAYTGTDDVEGGPDTSEVPPIRLADLTRPQRAAMHALCRPTMTIALSGIDASRPFTDPRHHIRLFSGSADGTLVYVARQRLGATVDVGAMVSITQHTVGSWTRDLVGLLPASAGPGSLPVDTSVAFQRVPGWDEALAITVVAPAQKSAAWAFLHPRPGSCGSIRVAIGSTRNGGRPVTMDCRYRDLPDDGRYLLLIDEPGSALGVDNTSFAKMLNRVVNTLRARHAAHVDSTT